MYSYHPPQKPDLEAAAANYRAEQGKNRGGCLTVWLGLSLAISLIAGFTIIQALDIFRPGNFRPDANLAGALFQLALLAGLVIANIVCIYGVFQWKRWGVYGLVGVMIASPLVELIIGTATGRDFVQPVVQIGVLMFLVRDKWRYFE